MTGAASALNPNPARMYHFVDTQFTEEWVREFARGVDRRSQHLTTLDRALGDADHGDSLDRGLRTAAAELDQGSARTIRDVLGVAGRAMSTHAGGATARLYGTFFLRLAAVAARSVTMDAAVLATGLRASRDAVVQTSRAVLGEKTLCDALTPAVEAMDAAVYGGLSLVESLEQAAQAAERGRDATASMVARRGRAQHLGAASLGHQDPGAASMAMLFRAAADVAAGDCRTRC